MEVCQEKNGKPFLLHVSNAPCMSPTCPLKGARTYCIINEQDQPAIGSGTIDKNLKNFCASENGTLIVSDRSTTRVAKSSRGF